jgi:hypothetical protein
MAGRLYRLPQKVDDALAAETVESYKEKAAKESPIYAEALNSNP